MCLCFVLFNKPPTPTPPCPSLTDRPKSNIITNIDKPVAMYTHKHCFFRVKSFSRYFFPLTSPKTPYALTTSAFATNAIHNGVTNWHGLSRFEAFLTAGIVLFGSFGKVHVGRQNSYRSQRFGSNTINRHVLFTRQPLLAGCVGWCWVLTTHGDLTHQNLYAWYTEEGPWVPSRPLTPV